jgi:hypothetical protein
MNEPGTIDMLSGYCQEVFAPDDPGDVAMQPIAIEGYRAILQDGMKT